MQLLLNGHGVFHGTIRIGYGYAKLLHLLSALFRRGHQTGNTRFQAVRGLIRFDTVIRHNAHVKSGVIDGVSGRGEYGSRHGHRLGKAVHIERRIVTGRRKDIRIFPGFRKSAVESIDRSDQPCGHRIQIATLTCGEVHGGSQRVRSLLGIKSGTGKVECCGCGILHTIDGICRSVLHRRIQRLRLFRCVAHRLIGQLHGLIDFRKALDANRADSGERQRHSRGELLAYIRDGTADLLQLAADFFNLGKRGIGFDSLFLQAF